MRARLPTWLLLIATTFAARAADPFLAAAGNDIRNGHGTGDVVLLRGVNLGGWLLFEPWMAPMDSSGLKDDCSARETLTRRFGAKACEELLAAYQDAYVTGADLDRIAALGLNVIRLPFWYRTLQDEDGAWREAGFRQLDRVVAAAWKRGLYTVLDLHGAPGGQSDGEATGRVRRKEQNGLEPDFWRNEAQLLRTEAIWRRLATRFKGNPAVAMYDLLNEPMGAPDREAFRAVQDRLYRAVRAVDPDHIITLETCWSGRIDGRDIGWCWEILPRPEQAGWSNVVYQLHNYEWDWKSGEKQIRSTDHMVSEWKSHRDWGVPCFIGEFNCMGHEQAWRHTLSAYTSNGMSWAIWSYKATHGTDSDSWGVYNPVKPMPRKPDLQRDSAEAIRAAWEGWRTEGGFAPNPMLHRVIKEATGRP